MLLDDSLRGVELVARFDGAIVDVGSGGGAPGIPLAHALPGREVVLLEAERRKCAFLEAWAPPNARVVWGRAEEQETDWAGVAVAKALAQPATAAEWCLPLVRVGGAAILWVGPTAERERVEVVADRLSGRVDECARRVHRDREDRPHTTGISPPRRGGEEAPARVSAIRGRG